jgi:mannose-6-phosphate isomerase-like protein (cupin superfamily)
MVEPMVIDVKELAKDNTFFRRVVFTGAKSQLVLMSLHPTEEIGVEAHDVDQLLFVVKGEGQAVIDGKTSALEKGTMICVPAGARHNVINMGDESMKLFTVYAPPQHAPGTIHATKLDAVAAETERVPA